MNSKKESKKKQISVKTKKVDMDKKNMKKEKRKIFANNIKKNKKKYILIISTIAVLALIACISIFINRYFINKKYKKYEDKMQVYGFDLLYDNESTKSYEKVTKLEVIKLALGSIYNTYDASYIGYMPEGKYEGDEWVKTAEIFGIIEEGKYNEKNVNDYASYWDFIEVFLNTRKEKLLIDVSYKKESSFKNLHSYKQEQNKYINDLVENGLIENSTKKIHLNKDIVKGQMNEIIVKYVDKYSSIAGEGETIVTKKESMPKNSEKFPYITYSIPKEVYEFAMINEDGVDYVSPRNLYRLRKEYYGQMEYRIITYFNEVLNVNYENITTEGFRTKINGFLLYNYENEAFEEYVNYVKNNKIKLEGKAEPLLPIVYYDGTDMRVRTRITFKIINSETDKNVVFGDLYNNTETPVTYKNKEYVLYVEIPMSKEIAAISYRTEIKSIINMLSDKTLVKDNAI